MCGPESSSATLPGGRAAEVQDRALQVLAPPSEDHCADSGCRVDCRAGLDTTLDTEGGEQRADFPCAAACSRPLPRPALLSVAPAPHAHIDRCMRVALKHWREERDQGREQSYLLGMKLAPEWEVRQPWWH